MGLGNRIKMHLTGTPGVGPVVLGAVFPGFTDFADHFTDGDEVEYWIQEGADFEHGYGTYSTGALSRDSLLETLSGGVYDDSAPAPLSFTSAAEIFTSATEDQRRKLPQPFIDGYYEAGVATPLESSGGVMSLDLAGRYYLGNLTEDTVLAISGPVAPYAASVEVDLIQDATGGWEVTYPASWLWPDGITLVVAPAAGARTRLIVSTAPDGEIHADGSVRATA